MCGVGQHVLRNFRPESQGVEPLQRPLALRGRPRPRACGRDSRGHVAFSATIDRIDDSRGYLCFLCLRWVASNPKLRSNPRPCGDAPQSLVCDTSRSTCVSSLMSKFPAARTLRKVSSRPLAFVMDNFVDATTLANFQRGRRPTAQMDGKAAMQQMLQDLAPQGAPSPLHHAFMTLISRELFEGQWGDNDAVRVNASSSSDPHNDGSARVSYPDGLHVDTNNNATFRSATCILYLNDIAPESGGATIFPLSGRYALSKKLGSAPLPLKLSLRPAVALPPHQALAGLGQFAACQPRYCCGWPHRLWFRHMTYRRSRRRPGAFRLSRSAERAVHAHSPGRRPLAQCGWRALGVAAGGRRGQPSLRVRRGADRRPRRRERAAQQHRPKCPSAAAQISHLVGATACHAPTRAL